MHVVYDIKNGDYIESESGERVQLYYPFDKEAIIKAWEFGLEEAWEAARKLAVDTEDGEMDNKSIKEAFGGMYFDTVFKLFTAKEAIQKIKEYEEKKAEKCERIEYLKHEDIKKDGKTVSVWYGGNDSRCRIREKEKGHFLKKALEETKDNYRKLMEEAISQTFEMMNKNKSEKEKEKGMKSGDKFIIELGEKIKQYNETPDGERNFIDTVYRIKGTNAAITESDLKNLEEYKKKPTIPREEIEKEGYEKGLNELWQTLKQVQEMILKDYEECTGLKFKYDLYFNFTPMELVEKFKEWEEKKKNEEVKVGDEITNPNTGRKAVVAWIEEDELWGCITHDQFFTANEKQKKCWQKTGKHYDEVEKIFQKLKEPEGEVPFL